MYPIIDLNYFEKDINAYLRGLEQTVINAAAKVSVVADRFDGLTGVWVGDKKISAIGIFRDIPLMPFRRPKYNLMTRVITGIKLRRWVTMHGLSLNVCPDMRYFDKIVPCGTCSSLSQVFYSYVIILTFYHTFFLLFPQLLGRHHK